MAKEIKLDVDLNNSKILQSIINNQKLNSEIDFVLKALTKNKCIEINPISNAIKYNLPYESKIALLITALELDNTK